MDYTYAQGDNLPPINTGKVGTDLTTLIVSVRATASFEGKITAGATAIATTIILDGGTASRLATVAFAPGIRAYIPRTREWILIQSIAGQVATVLRGEDDPGAVASTPAALLNNDTIEIIPLDAVPISASLVAADPTNQTAECTMSTTHTDIPAGSYTFSISFSDGVAAPNERKITWPNPSSVNLTANLIITADANSF